MKTKKRKATKKSSFSARMVPSMTSKDVLALGSTLVNELGLQSGVDTLGRWMCHHIAELIGRAESASTAEEKRLANAEAVNTITKFWEHRATYENRFNPFYELRPVIQVLNTLNAKEHPYLAQQGNTAAAVFDVFRRLMICLILKQANVDSDFGGAIRRSKKTAKYQKRDQQEFLDLIERFLTDDDIRAVAQPKTKKMPASQPEKYDEAIAKLFEEAHKILDRVEKSVPPWRAVKNKQKRERIPGALKWKVPK